MEFSLSSKVWVYQSNVTFNQNTLEALQQILSDFTKNWTAHNQELKASFDIKYNRFIVLFVDETIAGASGCSIDKSVNLMKAIEKEFNIELFDRFQIAWKQGEDILVANRNEFEQLITENKVTNETIVFNNLVKDLNEFNNSWEIAAKDSWHAKVFSF